MQDRNLKSKKKIQLDKQKEIYLSDPIVSFQKNSLLDVAFYDIGSTESKETQTDFLQT